MIFAVIVGAQAVLGATETVLAEEAEASSQDDLVAVCDVAVPKGVAAGEVAFVPVAEDLLAVLVMAFAAALGPWPWDVVPWGSTVAAYGPLAAWELEADTDRGYSEHWCGSAESKTAASAAFPESEVKKSAVLVAAIHQVVAAVAVGASFAARRAVAVVESYNWDWTAGLAAALGAAERTVGACSDSEAAVMACLVLADQEVGP